MKTIAIIAGGNSSEFGISVKSAGEVKKALEGSYNIYVIFIKGTDWYWEGPGGKLFPVNKDNFTLRLPDKMVRFDAAFIAIHGSPGEDGLLQGYFDMIAVPYTGCNLFCSAITFNKQACKTFLKEREIPMAASVTVRKGDHLDPDMVASTIGIPCFVKPNASGSSFGVSKVTSADQLEGALDKAYAEGDEVMIESVMNGMEVACGVMKAGGRKIIMPVTAISTSNEFFDYEAKYIPGKSEEVTPAPLPKDTYDRVRELSSDIYDWLGCKGIVRVDFIVVNNTPHFLEINTIPGMSKESIIPRQIAESGLTTTQAYSMIIEDIIKAGKE